MEFDITQTNVAVRRLIEETENPRHRFMLEAYDRKRTLMCETLEACGFDVPWPEGAYYVLAGTERLARRRSGFEDDARAAETLIREAGVGSVPGNSFYADPADGRYRLRFCYAKEMPVLEDACERLRAAFAG